MQQILDAILVGDTTREDYASLALPESYRAATVRKDEVDMFEGLDSRDKDPRKSLHVGEVALPELGPGEALVAVMASAINYNTVWTSIFEPVTTFGFLERYGRISPLSKRHDLPYHVVCSGSIIVSLWPSGLSSSTERQCATTSSPGFQALTPGPVRSTTPARSEPTTW